MSVPGCIGQRVDGPSNGVAPLPWDVHCNPTQMFHSEVRHVEVPHTAIVTVRTARRHRQRLGALQHRQDTELPISCSLTLVRQFSQNLTGAVATVNF